MIRRFFGIGVDVLRLNHVAIAVPDLAASSKYSFITKKKKKLHDDNKPQQQSQCGDVVSEFGNSIVFDVIYIPYTHRMNTLFHMNTLLMVPMFDLGSTAKLWAQKYIRFFFGIGTLFFFFFSFRFCYSCCCH